MKDVVIFGALAFAILLTFILVWNNRASEKIVAAVIPVSVAAIVAVLLAILVFGGEATIREDFRTSFVYRMSDKTLLKLPWTLAQHTPLAVSHPGWIKSVPSEFLEDRRDWQDGSMTVLDHVGLMDRELYHHLLQKAIIDVLSKKFKWHIDAPNFNLVRGPSKFLSTEEITKLLDGNIFANSVVAWLLPPRITLPPNTQVNIVPPTNPEQLHVEGFHTADPSEISFKNEYADVSIRIVPVSWGSGVGRYRDLLELEDPETDFANVTFDVIFQCQFSRFRSGHPDMEAYKGWATSMAEELRTRFDDELIWERMKEDYLFSKQVESLGRMKND